MLNINVSKLSSLIESKKQSNLNNSISSSNVNTSNISGNQNNNSLSMNQSQTSKISNIIDKKIPPFKVQSFPPDKFPLFNKKDFYHYNKKFHNELPNVIIPPISFHYTNSNENFCSFDIMTMMFGLKKSQEILTDSKLNTKIHKDFVDNSFNLIFPEKSFKNKSEEISKNMKDDILNIINSKEESEIQQDSTARKKDEMSNPFYLRRTTLISSALNLKKKNSGTFKNATVNNTSNNALSGASLVNLKKSIENSFESIDKLNEGTQHPHKKNVVAKNVYEILPFFEFSNLNMTQIIFPNDPLTDIQVDETDKNYLLPDKFLLKKNENSDNENQDNKNEIYSFFKNENFIDEEVVNEGEIDIKNERKKLKMAEYYSYERDYQVQFSNQNELFNRHIIFLDKNKKTANLLPIEGKLFLKKYKKIIPVAIDEDNYEMEKMNLGRKRERDLIVVPKNLEDEDVDLRNSLLKENGVIKEFVGIDVGSPYKDEIKKAKERILYRESNIKDRRERKEFKEGDIIKEDEEIEDFEDEEKEENDENDENDENEAKEEKENKDEKNEEIEVKSENDDEDDDILFAESESDNGHDDE